MVSITLAGAYNSGIRNFDVETAYQAALKNELGWEGRIEGAGKMDVNSLLKKVMCLMRIVFISAPIRKVPVSPYLIHWNIVLVLMRWLNGQKPWDVRRIINV